MEFALEQNGKTVREMIRQKLANNPYSQDHVDKVVEKTLDEIHDTGELEKQAFAS